LRLPKRIEDDPRAPTLLLRLATGDRLLWSGGVLPAADVAFDDALAAVLRRAHDAGHLVRGLESATRSLDAQERGLARADRHAGVARGERISRLLLVASDGAERFYRHVESLLARHGARAVAVRLDVGASELGERLFGRGAQAKLVMVDHKDAVADALLAIAASEPGGSARAPAPSVSHEPEEAMEITTERVSIDVDGGRMPAYLAKPKGGGPHPPVIVWMEIFGINAHIRDVTERVAREGYVALAPNFFHRTNPTIEVGYDEAGMAAGIGEMQKLDADQMIADARAALAWLRARPDTTEKAGVMGFCIGGHMTYLTAVTTDVAAAASFYGGGIAAPQGPGGKPSPVQRTNAIRGRIVCLFGAKDAMIPQPQVEAIRKALEQHSVRHEIVVYPDADHGFFCDQRATYHAASAKDAWERVKRLFAEELR